MSVGLLPERKERPAYVRFERVAVEDKRASLQAGRYVGKDVDFALVTPPYSKDIFKAKVVDWFQQLEKDMNDGRVPSEWVEAYRKQYQNWQNGQETPPNGTAIRGWGMISPAKTEALVRMNILTVEDLAGINDEGIKRIGMGGMELKNKARAWIAQVSDKGPLTQEVSALKEENDQLKRSIESLTKAVESLKSRIKSDVVDTSEEISVSDIIPEENITKPPKKRGRPKKI